MQNTLPKCASGIAPDCTGKISKTRHDAGETVCMQCEELNEQYLFEENKMRAFDNAETVHDLREWIREYML